MSSIIITGGTGSKTVDLINGNVKKMQCPNLPSIIGGSSMVLHNGDILLCGGEKKWCLQLDHGTWLGHSTLNRRRLFASAVSTSKGTFIFGGVNSSTFEYLPKGSTKWQLGTTKIPEIFVHGCAIEVKSGKEIWLIGGFHTGRRILTFDTNEHTFKELPNKLMFGRFAHRCAFIPGSNKLVITGGYDEYLTVEIL